MPMKPVYQQDLYQWGQYINGVRVIDFSITLTPLMDPIDAVRWGPALVPFTPTEKDVMYEFWLF